MFKGGYQIIDLKGVSISTNATTISGVHEAIEGNYCKPLLLTGINIDGVEKADVFVTVDTVDNSYAISAYNGTITIANDDNVTFTASA